jgi:hypothetical protein
MAAGAEEQEEAREIFQEISRGAPVIDLPAFKVRHFTMIDTRAAWVAAGRKA